MLNAPVIENYDIPLFDNIILHDYDQTNVLIKENHTLKEIMLNTEKLILIDYMST